MHFKSALVAQEGWQEISREMLFKAEYLAVATEKIRTPTNPKGRSWLVVHRKAAVVIAPMTDDGNLILIRQERIPIRATIWEMPAGQIDAAVAGVADPGPRRDGHLGDLAAGVTDPGYSEIAAVALRELREETGYRLSPTGELLSLGHFFSSPGFTDEHAYLFLARNVELADEGHARDESEAIVDCRSFTPREIARMIANGEIRDANTLAICARMIASGLLSFYG